MSATKYSGYNFHCGIDYANGTAKTVVIKEIKPVRCYKKPLLIYPPGGRPIESWNDWRRFV